MKKMLLFVVLLQFSLMGFAQIIADHTVVNKYENIPEHYIDEVKKMWLVVAGESHSQAYRSGLLKLESDHPAFAVSVVDEGTPEAYTAANLRVSRATWGDVDHSSGWIYSYGEEDWCASSYPYYPIDYLAVERTKAGLAYCNSNKLTVSAFGFSWCYDDGYELAHSYLAATKEYIDYCNDNNINTVVFFTTGPIGGHMAKSSKGAYDNSRRWQTIRDTVNNNPARVLLDHADILSYNSTGEQATETWNGHTYPVIHPENLGGRYTGHIGENGALKLAKATWWMLARMAGWDGDEK